MKQSGKLVSGDKLSPPQSSGRRQPVAAGWRTVKLGEVCFSKTETRNPADEPNSVFKYVDITSVDNVSKQIVKPKELSGRNAPSRARQIIRAGDVLVSTTRPNLNAVALVPQEFDNQIASTGFCVLRGGEEIDSEFLFSFVRTPEFVSSLTKLTKGALYPTVNDKQVFSQFISLPPKDEQRRIAGRLREQMAAVERARAAMQAQLTAAQKLPAALLRTVFTSPAAQRWPRRRLGEICELLPARSVASDGDTEVRAITSACLTETGFSSAGIKIARMDSDDANESKLTLGEILIARSNTPELVGRVAMFEGPADGVVASDLIIRLRPADERTGQFLDRYLSFLYLTGYWRERASGASGTMKKITRTQLDALEVPFSPLAEQQKIAVRLDAELTAARVLVETLETRLAEIELLPAALLRSAFSQQN